MTKFHAEEQKNDSQHYDIFLSYSRKDNSDAMRLKAAIQSLGYSVFYDQEVLEGDSNWRKTLARNLDLCTGLVFFRTGNSVVSKFCQGEVIIAEESDKEILPVSYLRDQKNLPNSDELKFTLLPRQTTCISDFSSVAGIKNELQSALEKSIGQPAHETSSLILTEFMNAAAENLTSRYWSFFDRIAARGFTTDVDKDQIKLKWRLTLGDDAADLCVALNKYSRRSVCFANCPDKKQCPFFNEKNQTGYFLEAYLDFMDKLYENTPFKNWLNGMLKSPDRHHWCGNRGIKYFFRKPILPGVNPNDKNDFQAVLVMLEDAVGFYDETMRKLASEAEFAADVFEIFRDEKIVSSILNSVSGSRTSNPVWILSSERSSREKLHFHNNDSKLSAEKCVLGKLCSVAIRYPEALRIRFEDITAKGITLRLFRFKMDRQVSRTLFLELTAWKAAFPAVYKNDPIKDEPKNFAGRNYIRTELKKAIDQILPEFFFDKCSTKFSSLPDVIHEELAEFIKKNSSLRWEVSQNTSDDLFVSGYFYHSDALQFPKVNFAFSLEYEKPRTLVCKRKIISDFIRSEEDEARLSEITGWDLKTIPVPGCFEVMTRQLNAVHNKVYQVYTVLNEFNKDVLMQWKVNPDGRKPQTITVLSDGSRSNSVNASENDETCWEYYLANGTRLYRKTRSNECPVMFSIRFVSAGARDASIGWCADYAFNTLSAREKEIFWRYVLAQFPKKLRGRFAYRNNAVFLTRREDSNKAIGERRPELFETLDKVRPVLEQWMIKSPQGSLMDQMFSAIRTAIEDFRILG